MLKIKCTVTHDNEHIGNVRWLRGSLVETVWWIRRWRASHPFWTFPTFDDAVAVFRVGLDDVITIHAAATTDPCDLVFNLTGIGSAFRVILKARWTMVNESKNTRRMQMSESSHLARLTRQALKMRRWSPRHRSWWSVGKSPSACLRTARDSDGWP